MRLVLWLVLGVVLAFFVQQSFGPGASEQTSISYSAFREQLETGNVQSVEVQGERLSGTLAEPATREVEGGEPQTYERFVTFLPSFGDGELMSMLEAQGVEVNTQPAQEYSCWPILSMSLLPILLILGLGYLFMRRMAARGQNVMSIGKSRAKLYDKRMEEVHFEDVAGCQSAKLELGEIVEFLKDPSRWPTTSTSSD